MSCRSCPVPATAEARIQLPRTGLAPEDLGVIVNDNDRLSRQIGDYYRKARHIPASNMVHVTFTPGREVLSEHEFQKLKIELDRQRRHIFKLMLWHGLFLTGWNACL